MHIAEVTATNQWQKLEDIIKQKVSDFVFESGKEYTIQNQSNIINLIELNEMPTEADFISNGYFPFMESEIPYIVLKENQYWSPLFILKNNKIIQSWEVIENVSIQS